MSNLQPTYATGVAKYVPGMSTSEEKTDTVSRTVESAAGIAFGQPAFRGAADHGCVAGGVTAGTAAAAADAANVGASTITASPPVAAPAVPGRYVGIARATSATSKVDVYRPDGTLAGVATVGTPATIDGVGPFTITNSTTTAGDRFNIDVSLSVNARLLGITRMTPAVSAVASTPDAFPQYSTAAVKVMGGIALVLGGTVTQGQQVYWDPATKTYSADTTKVRMTGWVFDEGGVSGDLVNTIGRLRTAY